MFQLYGTYKQKDEKGSESLKKKQTEGNQVFT